MSTVKVSDYVVRFIADLGLKHVFFIPGGAAMHLNDSLGRCRDLVPVCNLHEQASAIAAEAYAKVTGNFGIAMVTAGPGGTNAITGVAGAWLDSTPCMFISGQVKRADLKGDSGSRQLGVQEVDIVSLVTPITKYAVTVLKPNLIRYELEKAVYLATSGRQGPVWIDLPIDVQGAMVDTAHLDAFTPDADNKPGLPDDVARAIEVLNASERPVLLAGNGIRLAHAEQRFAELVDLLGIPVLSTWLSFDLLPDSHALCFGRPGSIAPRGPNFALQNADALLTIGARLDMAMAGYSHANLARKARKIVVDIDAAEIRKIKTAIELPVVADAGDFIDELLRQRGRIVRKERRTWISRCADWKCRYPVVLPEHRAAPGPVSMYHFSEILSEELQEGDVVASGSSGFGCEIFLLVVKPKPQQRIFHTRGLGAMGFGIPAAIGACFASGLRRTVCVDGDGGFQMNIQELETVVRHRLPIKFFVVNNSGYASIRSSQSAYFQKLLGCDASSGLTLPDLCRIGSAYGIETIRIDRAEALDRQVRHVLEAPGPVLCDVRVLADEPRAPRLSSERRADGSMVSKPLEDLWPFLDRDEFLSNMLIPPVEE